MTLREALEAAREHGQAVGHFNISDSNQLNGICAAARELNVPVVIGVSEGEREYVGMKKTVAMAFAAHEEFGVPVFVNADHTHSIDGCKQAIEDGCDAVIFDGAKLSLDENIAQTKEVVAYARQCGRDVLIEGELGYIGSSSKVMDERPEGAGVELTKPEDAARFVAETEVDLLAPSVGNLHGMLKSGNPRLDIGRISEIALATHKPLVLHGGSGIADDDFRAAIRAGMRIVHINTEIRIAYRKGIEQGLARDAEETTPAKYLDAGRDAVQAVVKARLALFSGR
jgi:fructose-bisphosphate aldolase class II